MTPLTREQIDPYKQDGFLILRSLFSPEEIERAKKESEALCTREDLIQKNNLRVRWTYHCETYEEVFELFDPIIDISPQCKALALHPHLFATLRALLDDEIFLFKDKLIYKPSGAAGYPLHQDYIAWPAFPESFTTVVIALDAADEENGCIEVFPGAHKKGCLSERDGNFHILDDELVEGFSPVALTLAPGDAAIFGCFMPHRSGINRSAGSRRHLLFSYNAARDGGEQRAAHYQAYQHYLRGVYGAMGLGDLYFK